MDNKQIAKERIQILFKEADKIFNEDKELANNYVKKARRLSMKFKIRISSEFKRKFCKHCYSYLKLGKNVRVRNNKSKVVYYCLECKKYMRFPIHGRKTS